MTGPESRRALRLAERLAALNPDGQAPGIVGDLVGNPGLSMQEIARKYGVPPGRVSRLWKFRRFFIPPTWWDEKHGLAWFAGGAAR
jgi:hypothetical protein